MKGFPKAIGTGQDLLNCLALVQAKELAADDLKNAIAGIEAQAFITCPIVAVSGDRKTVTINYCPEAQDAQTINSAAGCTITAVNHQASGTNGAGGSENTPDQSVITLSAALGTDETALKIPSPASPLAALGITQDQLNSIKGVLKQYE
jgi:hypothetical protein